ncbi:uncharacterized protein [Coffea arabica]|uniref:Reverse transcriptase domain-containing protein n=1 Tax=Coffea arabica TaxID=13443 RepID=A0ABM4U637_COFAR
MLHLIPSLITEEENKTLEEVSSMEEVRRVVFAMDGESAAGLDGFMGKFFTFSWDVIAQDVYNVVLSFFYGAELPKFITSTSITDFVKGRNITENYLLAQEVLSGIGKPSREGNVALKLDMSKACDKVSWLHIGDPLSPALFVIGAEVLSLDLNNLALQSGFVGFRVPHGCLPITHLAFADDVIIFANGSSNSLKCIMRVLELYHQSSRQLVNAQKSGYLVHPSLPPSRRMMIEQITQFAQAVFPNSLLGIPPVLRPM